VLNCDTSRITLWGHSAGAGDVNWLAMSPMANTLFARAIIQSGSSFAYWGYDKKPLERYRSLRAYFNCTGLPETHTADNGAMTTLIEQCLTNASLDALFAFKFALIDAPGPVYDGTLITAHTPKQMLEREGTAALDILTGINGVEGFSFEGYFSSSVAYWLRSNVTTELALTAERFALLSRDKCIQHSVIDNRLLFTEYYERKLAEYVRPGVRQDEEAVRRLMAIFLNSDAIFDSGFIELLTLLTESKRKSGGRTGRLFVYEYLYENAASAKSVRSFKDKIKEKYMLSTHFDGIDSIFGIFYQMSLYLFLILKSCFNLRFAFLIKVCRWLTFIITKKETSRMITRSAVLSLKTSTWMRI
jgi:hypothetical protein